MHTKFSIVPVLLLLLFSGCFYEPTGEHFKELEQEGTPPYVEVELNFDTDTLYICNNEWVLFRYQLNGDKVNWARFILDGRETSPNPDQQGGVELSWYFPGFQPGIHTLSMQLYTRSGTGSIADHLGAEGFLLQKDWVLKIVDDWEIGPAVVGNSFENGLLNIHWKKYMGLNFEQYKVYKYVQPSGLPDQLVASVTDQHQTSVADPNYHGENSRYYVVVNDRYRGKSTDIEGPLPQVTAANNAQGDIVLRWEKPAFWAALKGYRIMDDDISWTNAGFIPLYLVEEPRVDSFLIPDPYFAHKYDLWLQLDPKNNSYYEFHTRPVFLATLTTASYGHESPGFHWVHTATENVIYLLDYEGLKFFNTKTLETTVPQNIPRLFRTHVSDGNNYLASMESNSNKLFLYDLKHPENSKSIDLNAGIPDPGHLVSVSDNGTGILLSGQKAVLYDYLNEQVLAEKVLKHMGLYRNHISGDGNYFTLDTYGGYSWYSCENNTITELTDIKAKESGTVFSDFIPGERTQLVAASAAHASVYDCQTQELLHRWPLETGVETTIYHVVKSSRELFISEGDNLVLLDLKTGDRTVLGKSTNTSKWDLVYNNGQILWREGKRMDVTGKL